MLSVLMTADDRCAQREGHRPWRRAQALIFGAAVVAVWWFWGSAASADEGETGTTAQVEAPASPQAPAAPQAPEAPEAPESPATPAAPGGVGAPATDGAVTQPQQELSESSGRSERRPLTSTMHAATPSLAPVAQPVTATVDDLAAPLDVAVTPVAETLLDPVVPVAQPVTATVDQAVAPVVAPMAPVVAPVVTPLHETVLAPAAAGVDALVPSPDEIAGTPAAPASSGTNVAPAASPITSAPPVSSNLGPAADPGDQQVAAPRRARSLTAADTPGSSRGVTAGETLPTLQGAPALPGARPTGSPSGRSTGVPVPRSSSGSSSSGGSDTPDRTHRAGPSLTAAAPAATPAASAPLGTGIVGPSKDLGSRPAFTPD
jgi:hypothetical protein